MGLFTATNYSRASVPSICEEGRANSPATPSEVNMNVKLSIILIVCAALLVSSCGSATQNLILGKWEVEGAPLKMTAEFNRDGTAKITMFGQTVQGTYKLSADNELEWSMNGISTKGTVKVTAEELELTNDQNQTIKYKR